MRTMVSAPMLCLCIKQQGSINVYFVCFFVCLLSAACVVSSGRRTATSTGTSARRGRKPQAGKASSRYTH